MPLLGGAFFILEPSMEQIMVAIAMMVAAFIRWLLIRD